MSRLTQTFPGFWFPGIVYATGESTDYGTPFNQRTLNPTGGTGDGTFGTLAGSWWASAADNANIGHADGTGGAAKFYFPNGMCCGADGYLYLSEFGFENGAGSPPELAAGQCIRRITRDTGVVTTAAGPTNGAEAYVDGTGSAARFHSLVSLFPTTTGILIAEYGCATLQGNARIRFMTYAGVVSTVAFTGAYTNVNGPAATASMIGPNGVTMGPDGSIYVCGYDQAAPNAGQVRKIANDTERTVTTIATGLALPANLVVGDDGFLYVIGFSSGTLYRINLTTFAVTTVTTELGFNANGIALGNGVLYYVLAGPGGDGDVIRRVEINGTSPTDIAGRAGMVEDGALDFHSLSCVAYDGTHLYAGESYGNRVTKMIPA